MPRPSLALGPTTAIMALVVFVGCVTRPERLPELDRRFYYNLPSSADQQAFLETKASKRQAFLQDIGLWDQWMALPSGERSAILRNEVELGFHEFGLFMAWGPPADTQKRALGERTLERHTFIRCSSGPKRGRYVKSNLDCDGTSSETQVSIHQGVVVEIAYPH